MQLGALVAFLDDLGSLVPWLVSQGTIPGRIIPRPFVGVRVILPPTEFWSNDIAQFRLAFDMTQQPQICTIERELPIDKDKPFQFDRLGREPSCDLLTSFATHVERPCTIAIDAAWGHGKTTFLRLWAAHLRLEQNAFLVIEVNAWKTDYFNDPFLAIVGEMTKQLKASGLTDAPNGIGLSRLKECFTTLIAIVPHFAASRVGLTSEDVDKIAAAFKSDTTGQLEQYEEQLASVEEFRSALESVAQEVRNKTGKPLIVLIDELDRCRPTYAVEFLEVVKHLLAVDHVVYAFAMYRSELAHTVKGFYGPEFDGKGYLRRFFDVDFTLPEPSRQYFITFLLEEQLTGLITNQDARGKTARLLHAFLDVEWISLRQIQQALYRFRLALVLAREDIAKYSNYVEDFCIALILRVYDPDMLGEFLRGELSDKDVVERWLPPTVRGNGNLLEERLWFEMAIIRAAQEIADPEPSTSEYDHTPLFQAYKDIVDSTSDSLDATADRYFVGRLVEKFENRTGPGLYSGHSTRVPRRFKLAVKWLEMLELLKTSS